jgi:hypothetical protein
MDRSGQGWWRGAGERLSRLDPRWVGLAALVAAMLAAAALILYLERGTTYMSDEWAWIGYAGEADLADMMRPLNQHLTVLPLLLSKLFLAEWETSFLPFKLAEVVGVMASGAVVYAFARPRVGPLVALAPAMVPMFLGTATVILLQPLIGLQVIYSIAFGVGALVAVDRGTRGGDLAAAVLACLSLATFSVGIAFLAGLTVAVLLFPDSARRAYVFLVPAILYGAWRVWANKYGTGGGPELSNVPAVPFYYTDSIASTTTAFFGQSFRLGPGPGTSLFVEGFTLEQASAGLVFIAIEVVVIAILARRLARSGPIPAMLWAALATLATLWTIQGLVLVVGRTPGEPRYIYPGAVALALVLAAAASRVRFSRTAVAAILGLTAVGIVGNIPRFKEGRGAIDYHAPRVLAYTGLMDLAGEHADPDFVPAIDTPIASPAGALSISTGAYQTIAARYGPYGYTPSQILEQDDEIRHGSDEVMVGLLRLRLTPTASGTVRCHRARAGGGEGIALPRGGAVLRSSGATTVYLRRFAADHEHVEVGRLDAGQAMLLRIPLDRSRLPWILEASRPVSLGICVPANATVNG